MTRHPTLSVRILLWLCASLLFSGECLAENVSVRRAREYFHAGAQAYSIGEYGAAIQAFEQAYALAPRPAVLFSIAQAERRQYFLDRDQKHLVRAIEMYRLYLAEEVQAARKSDAVQALSELEPLSSKLTLASAGAKADAKGIDQEPGRAPTTTPMVSPTRLMISSPAQGATIAIDGQTAVSSPMVRELDPGEHVVRIEATGYRSAERRVIAVSGELVNVDVPLVEKPALLEVRAPADSQLSIDGRVQGRCPFPKPIELSSGAHLITVSKSGFVGISREQTLVRGKTTVFAAALRRSKQRTAALFFLGASASALTTGAIFGYIAYKQESAAETFLKARGDRVQYPKDLAQYNSSRGDYNLIRGGAWLSVGIGVGLGLTGLLLRTYDSGSVETIKDQQKPQGQSRRRNPSLVAEPLIGPSYAGLGLHGAF